MSGGTNGFVLEKPVSLLGLAGVKADTKASRGYGRKAKEEENRTNARQSNRMGEDTSIFQGIGALSSNMQTEKPVKHMSAPKVAFEDDVLDGPSDAGRSVSKPIESRISRKDWGSSSGTRRASPVAQPQLATKAQFRISFDELDEPSQPNVNAGAKDDRASRTVGVPIGKVAMGKRLNDSSGKPGSVASNDADVSETGRLKDKHRTMPRKKAEEIPLFLV